ncbi:MarR family transcriptional regulator [Spongiactinospora gelatinilytica]|uniref:MarR family transcriptional regulator n=1 Tax=Spongiactinospora gelatinilytica TaxID=2666298 RepID=A0A2W2EYH0_9ACTN|nr:MarR family transcriptional regulator [Spongiactinospora gelatinilytica]
MQSHLMQQHLMRVHLMFAPGTLRRVSEEAIVAAWRQLLAQHASTWCALERELGEKHGLGPSEFEVLDRMVESGHDKFRVQELADAVHLSQSALSRLIARLERAGLVGRNICEADRRGIFVCITPEGRARHAAALPTHRAVLAATLTPSTPALVE